MCFRSMQYCGSYSGIKLWFQWKLKKEDNPFKPASPFLIHVVVPKYGGWWGYKTAHWSISAWERTMLSAISCITGFVKNRMEDLTLHFTAFVDLHQPTVVILMQFKQIIHVLKF